MNEVAHVSSTPKPRRRYSFKEKADYLERFLQSGLSMAEFCRQTHLATSCLQRWLKLIEPSSRAQEVSASQSPPLFQELPLPKVLANASWSVELSRANGTVLRLAQPVSPQLLEQLLRVC
jgi:transposase-like protein